MEFPVTGANPEYPFEVQFKSKDQVEFFDLETLSQTTGKNEPVRSMRDHLKKMYYVNFLKMDFGYIEKVITVKKEDGEGPELMFMGPLKFTGSKYVMQSPTMVIGTDRLELYEFYARRKEVLLNSNR